MNEWVMLGSRKSGWLMWETHTHKPPILDALYMFIHVFTCLYMFIHVYTRLYMFIHVYTIYYPFIALYVVVYYWVCHISGVILVNDENFLYSGGWGCVSQPAVCFCTPLGMSLLAF